MPEYTFLCEKCRKHSTLVCHMREYDEVKKKVRCGHCNSKKVFRDFSEDQVTSNVIAMLSESRTLGEYADKQSKKYGKEKCELMRESFKTKKKENTGMKELPSGMKRVKTVDDLPRKGRKK
jgi:DNA-directed RNA polymerase subunit RPC12/RpoP